jgi:nitrogen regulatory protein PII
MLTPREHVLRWTVDMLTKREHGTGASCPYVFVPAIVHRRGYPGVKQVIAIVKPFLAEKVLEGLKRAPLEACSVREVKGYGRQKSYLDQYADSEYSLAFLPKVEITLWVDDGRVEEILRKIVEVARTGRMGDGKIFVVPTVAEQVVDF